MNPKFKKSVYVGTSGVTDKYVNGLKKYYMDIINLYEEQQKDYYHRYKNYDIPISEELHRMLIDAYAITGMNNSKLKLTSRTELLDLYRVEITIEYTVKAIVGSKISGLSGGKGVIVGVNPTEEMPITVESGIRADIIVDPTSMVGRMIPGRLYEGYFNMLSRKGQQLVREKIKSLNRDLTTLSDSEVTEVWKIVLGLTHLLDTEQHEQYTHLNKTDKRIVLKEIVEDEFFLYYKISSKKKAYQVVADALGTIYEPQKEHISFMYDGRKIVTKDKHFIATEYTILLAKTADNYLSTASSKTNHYGMPIGVSSKSRDHLPYRNSPTKILSETESRLYTAYVGRFGIAELKDRATSRKTHTHLYHNILTSGKPTNIDCIVDRNIIPYGDDAALQLIDNIFNSSGIRIEYVADK